MKNGIYIYAVQNKHPNLESFLKKTDIKSIGQNNLLLIYEEIDIEKTEKEVSNASKNLMSIKKLLEAHEEVINRLAYFGTLIPFRFGTVVKDLESAEKLLEEKKDFFEKLLAKIKGKEEWGIRIYISEFFSSHIFKENPIKNKKQSSKMSGTNYLLKIKKEKDAEKNETEMIEKIAKEVINKARVFATEVSSGNPNRQDGDTNELLLSSSFLIRIKDRDKFKDEMESLKKKYQEMGINLELSGPWQPYSFV